MTNAVLSEILRTQLALDCGVSRRELEDGKFSISPFPDDPAARRTYPDGCALKIIVTDGAIHACCIDSARALLEPFLRGLDGAWLSEPQTLVSLDGLLRGIGQRVGDVHHYCVPLLPAPPVPDRPEFSVSWHDREAIESFRGDDRFGEALLFDERCPDMLAVTVGSAADAGSGEILAMAGASRDSERLWQIGVNVTPRGRGLGLGSYSVALLRDRLLAQDVVPFYGTAESHIKSQRAAFRAGFIPSFFELHSEPNPTNMR